MRGSAYERPNKLFTPGPVNIPNRVSLASIGVCYHHRVQAFAEILGETLEMLKPVFGTVRQVYPIHTTGRGAMEGVINNILTPEDKAIAVCNGSFGAMAAKILERNGIPCVRCFESWEASVDLEELEQLIREQRATAITVVHNDTSNGLVNPIWDIGRLARKYDLMLIVDSVSAAGCMPFRFDEWGVDAVVTASQKGLMSPAGMSFCVLSEKAEQASERITSHDFYIDLKSIRKSLQKNSQTPGSTPVSLVLAVHEAVKMIGEEGLEQVYARHQDLSARTKQALEAMGFSLFPEHCRYRSDSLTVAAPPAGVDSSALVKHMREQYHIQIGKGLGDYADGLIRIAHMGYCYEEDMLQCIAVLEASMADLGWRESAGAGVQAFIKARKG